jgi:hypothetical protein
MVLVFGRDHGDGLGRVLSGDGAQLARGLARGMGRGRGNDQGRHGES